MTISKPSKQAIQNQQKVYAALSQAVDLLESVVVEQESAANRILGLAELVSEKANNPAQSLRAEGIMEACAFQDLSGQKIRKVNRLLKFLRDRNMVDAADLPKGKAKAAPEPASGGLSQEEVDRLLNG